MASISDEIDVFDVLSPSPTEEVQHGSPLIMMTTSFKQPPAEILTMILKKTLPLSFLLDPALWLGPRSAWCQTIRMKKALPLVCKLWNEIATPLLYEDVTIRRVGEICAFRHSLELNSQLEMLVRSITISCFLPRGYSRTFTEDLDIVLKHCPALQSFTCQVSNPTGRFLEKELLPLPAIPLGGITQLDFQFPDYDTRFHQQGFFGPIPCFNDHVALHALVATHAPNLVSLSISYNIFIGQPAIPFPRLESLTLYENHSPRPAILTTEWVMPCLRRLTVKDHINRELYGCVYELLQTLGHTITFLDMGPNFEPQKFYKEDPQDMSQLCPNLEHIVQHKNIWLTEHPAIKWIDAVGPPQWAVTNVDNPADFPSLCGFRQIHNLGYIDHLPTSIPPDSAPCSYVFPGIHYYNEHGHLYHTDSVLYSPSDTPLGRPGLVDISPDENESDSEDSTYASSTDESNSEDSIYASSTETDSLSTVTDFSDEQEELEDGIVIDPPSDDEWETVSESSEKSLGIHSHGFYGSEKWEATHESTLVIHVAGLSRIVTAVE